MIPFSADRKVLMIARPPGEGKGEREKEANEIILSPSENVVRRNLPDTRTRNNERVTCLIRSIHLDNEISV